MPRPSLSWIAIPTLLAAIGCETIAGYDGRSPRPPPRDAVVESDAGDGADGGDGDAPIPESRGCLALRASCPAETPYCSVYFDTKAQRHTFACVSEEAASAAPGLESECARAPGECGDGLACGYAWASGYHCTKLCKTDAECTASRPFCNHPLTFGAGLGPLSMCEACDPVKQSDCRGAKDACVVRSVTAAPSCGAVAVGAGGLASRCAAANDCQRGLLCVCRGGQGIGDDCAGASDGACRFPCYPFERGSACSGAAGQPSPGVCVAIGARALYSYCRPAP